MHRQSDVALRQSSRAPPAHSQRPRTEPRSHQNCLLLAKVLAAGPAEQRQAGEVGQNLSKSQSQPRGAASRWRARLTSAWELAMEPALKPLVQEREPQRVPPRAGTAQEPALIQSAWWRPDAVGGQQGQAMLERPQEPAL